MPMRCASFPTSMSPPLKNSEWLLMIRSIEEERPIIAAPDVSHG